MLPQIPFSNMKAVLLSLIILENKTIPKVSMSLK